MGVGVSLELDANDILSIVEEYIRKEYRVPEGEKVNIGFDFAQWDKTKFEVGVFVEFTSNRYKETEDGLVWLD